jgi:hypothetical protein
MLPAVGRSCSPRRPRPVRLHHTPRRPGGDLFDTRRRGARGDGVADDSLAIQAAIDKAAATPNGVVFIPPGRYRLTRTIYVWRAVRVFGYGATRPVFVLGPNTPGYQKGIGLMAMFTNAGPPGAPPGSTRVLFRPPGAARDDVPDASPVTFYSAMSKASISRSATATPRRWRSAFTWRSTAISVT